MKFSEKLGAHLTPEWRQQYIAYADLKEMIVLVSQNAPVPHMTPPAIISEYYKGFEEEFFFECDKELRKINTFYSEKLAEAIRRSESLGLRLELAAAEFRLTKITQKRYTVHVGSRKAETSGKTKKEKLNVLRNAYSELYLSLVLLQNYKVLNYTGFRKILKKYDKLLNTREGKRYYDDYVKTAYFYANDQLNDIIDEVEFSVTEYLEDGDRGRAMKRLRVPPLEETQELGTVFRVGFTLGAFTVLLGFILLSNNIQTIPEAEATYGSLLFRAPFYMIFYLFLLGMNVLSWRQYGVNHVLIFEIDPRKRLTYTHVLELHGIFGIIWALCVVGYIHADFLGVSPYWFPLIVMSAMIIFLITPCDMWHRSGRVWVMRLMWRVCCAPLYPVGFADFWFGDQLNSMVNCVVDLKYFICFYIHKFLWGDNVDPSACLEHDFIGNAIIRCVPPWVRLAQCLRRFKDTWQVHPFLVNAGKYFSSFPMVLFSTLMSKYKGDYPTLFDCPYTWLYLASATVQTLYCFAWDVLRDFGLFRKFSGRNIFLRDEIIYAPLFYYFVIVENIILRFFWAIAFYLVNIMHLNGMAIDSVAGCLEIIRRYIWNYLRLENEHLYNVGNFRAVRDIYLAPIDESRKSVHLEDLMDDNDGVKNRRKSKKDK